MEHTVYFADKSVIFTRTAPAGTDRVVVAVSDGPVSRTKIGKILETNNTVAVVADDPDAAFAAFAAIRMPVFFARLLSLLIDTSKMDAFFQK